MEGKEKQKEIYKIAHILILLVYALFSMALFFEIILLGWEYWVIPIIVAGVMAAWYVHITKAMGERARAWFYAVLMMSEFFFYGIHTTAVYDMSVIMAGIMMVYGMSGIGGLITAAQLTYFVTYGYDIVAMTRAGYQWDILGISRVLVHGVVIIVIGYIIRLILREWHSANESADKRVAELRSATDRMDDFLVNVSHEIRTPVNAVIGLTDVMLTDPLFLEKDRKELYAVNSAGHRIAEQIGDILDYTEIDMKKLVVTSETYMLSSILNDLVTDLSNTIETKLELIIDVDPALPKALSGDAIKIKKILRHLIVNGLKFTPSGGVYVHIFSQKRDYGINLCIEVTDTGDGMDEDEIERMFDIFYQSDSSRSRSISGLGLGSTIVYGFVREMGGFLTVDSGERRGTSVNISIPQAVVDAASCMSIENKVDLCIASLLRYRSFSNPQIREFYTTLIMHLTAGLGLPFYQAESMDNLRDLIKKYELTHLFIGAEEYMAEPSFYENMARRTLVVVVADESFSPREGSKIRIIKKPFYCFPVIHYLEMNVEELKAEDSHSIMSVSGVSALVVDDEPMNLIVAEGVFKKYGMEVTLAASGMDAISLCKDNRYDIIFMDHMMSQMDGIEAMHRIRALNTKHGNDTLFVALTANVISSARNMFLSEGFDGFLAKPIEKVELERVLKRLLPSSAIVHTSVNEKRVPPVIQETPKEDPLSAMGLDTEMGMSYCQNDADFYDTILLEYASKAGAKYRELEDYYQNEDWKDYTIRIHALKSNSKMIGAMELFEMARDLEAAAKEADAETIRAGHRKCMDRYLKLSSDIMKYHNEMIGEQV